MKWSRLFPITEWIKSYSGFDLKADVIAGFTVAIMLVPQGMAYAFLAGLPLIYGLYAGLVPLFLYPFFGTSRQLSVGPVAIVSLLVLTGLSSRAVPGSSVYIQLAILVGLLAGVIQILFGLFRLGVMANFLSHPVISGFTSAAGIIIGFSQVKNLFGISFDRTTQIQDLVLQTVAHIAETHWPTLLISIVALGLLLLLKKVQPKLPAALAVVALGVAVVSIFRLDLQGVAIVGDVPRGLPAFSLPTFPKYGDGKEGFSLLEGLIDLLPLALTICLISFIESLAIARTLESRHKTYKVDANQELLALGISKIGGGFFQAFPTTGSFTRSAINDDNGARTGMSSFIAAAVIGLTLAFFTPAFYFLPNAVLAAIILAAVIKLVNIKEARHLWHTDRKDFITLLITFAITLIVGVQAGVFSGIAISILMVVYRNSLPHIAILGQLPDTSYYRNISRFPSAQQPKGLVILRFDAPLYFGNSAHFKSAFEELFENPYQLLSTVVLDAASIHDIDSTGIQTLRDVIQLCHRKKITFQVSGVIGPVRDLLAKTGLMKLIGKENQFMYVHDAVTFYKNQKADCWDSAAVQTNLENEKEDQRRKN